MDSLDFSITWREVPVTITLGGEVKKYVLREASADAGTQWRNALMACSEIGEDEQGKPRAKKMVGLANIEPLLVSLCLFDSEGKQVTETLVRSWPARIVAALYKKAAEISELIGGETPPNSPSATPASSA